jgi:hypothetical protein
VRGFRRFVTHDPQVKIECEQSQYGPQVVFNYYEDPSFASTGRAQLRSSQGDWSPSIASSDGSSRPDRSVRDPRPPINSVSSVQSVVKASSLLVVAFTFSLLIVNPGHAATNEAQQTVQQLSGAVPQDTSQPKRAIEEFFEAIAKNDVDSALKTLFKGAQLTADAERELNAGIKKALAYYGTPRRFDLVSETPRGPVVVKYVYTQSFDTLPLAWSFFAYQNSDGWVFISAQFSDKTDLLQ